jgi:biotin carboxyl carrier protein
MGKKALLAALFLAASGFAQTTDQFTPLVASGLTADARPFPATDGKTHLTYELVLTNASATEATLQKVAVVDPADPSHTLAAFEGADLLARLRTPGAARVSAPTVQAGQTRLLLIDFALDPAVKTPSRLMHSLALLGTPAPSREPMTPVAMHYTVAPIEIHGKLPKIGPPLKGDRWVAVNGCCDDTGVHRSSSMPCNGGIYAAQRFAIDWMQLDHAGRLVEGDPANVHSYPDYGADVIAVAEGKVVAATNDLEDQKPGTLPDPSTINMQNVDGNHIVIDLGGGVYAFYAHLQKDSLAVHPGERVKRGQVLAKLGNTGNTSAPHLHFHLMESPSVLCSNGIPYVIDSFALTGQVSIEEFAKATGAEGDWGKGMLPSPSERHDQYPMNLNIVTLP